MRIPDETDFQILRILQSNGKISNADLAKEIELSPPSTLQRVRMLEQAGLIRGYVGLVDAERLGMRLLVLCDVSLSLHQEQPIERFIRAVQAIPEVLECYHVSGSSDFHLKIVARDMKHYESLIREKLSKIRGVGQINSSFVLAKHKETSRIPL